MASQVTNYQCPNCDGPLQFDARSGKLMCEYCGSSFEVAQIEAMFAQKNESAVQAAQDSGAWDTSELNADWGAEAGAMTSYCCPSCGAELIADQSTAATSCPYCGNPTIVPGQFAGTLRPDYVIPFYLNKDQAIAELKNHYKGKIFLPREFTSQQTMDKIQGVYVPFWLFDGQAAGSCTYNATYVQKYEDSDEEVITTDYYNLYRSGSIRFEKVPVDASSKMPDEYMDSIEPYNYGDLRQFSTAYLPGFLADKFDMSVEQCQQRADERCENTLEAALRKTTAQYTTSTLLSKQIQIYRGKVHYAMLPVWMMHVKWNNKDYLFAINGQTGKVCGELPISRAKVAALFAAIAGPLGIIAHLIFNLFFA